MLLLGEQPSLLALLGLLLIVVGVLAISGGRVVFGASRRRRVARRDVGLIAGAFVAGYTVIDGWAVRYLFMSPFRGGHLRQPVRPRWCWRGGRCASLSRCARNGGSSGRRSSRWQRSARSAIAVLFAMKLAPVSHVAPAREVSMLIAAFFGAKLLDEGDVVRRVAYAGLIAAGVVCLVWT